MKQRTYNILFWVIVLTVLYTIISTTVYALRHPERTMTQVFLETPDAWRWK